MFGKVSDWVTSLLAIAAITALVLPGRETARVIGAGGSAGSALIKAATGR